MLSGIKVLDIGSGVSSGYCSKIFSNLGAQVIKIESAKGDSLRYMGPFPEDKFHIEKSAMHLSLNMGKHSIVLDFNNKVDIENYLRLSSKVDIIIENHPLGELDKLGIGYNNIKNINKEIIFTSITPFGNEGPYKNYKLTDLVLFHMAGHSHGLLGPVENPEIVAPIRAGGYQAEFVVGMASATATMIALYRKISKNKGSHITISSFESMVTQLISGLANCAYNKPVPSRDLNLQKEASVGGMVTAIGGILPCNDGYVAISPREDAQWERWLQVMDSPEWANQDRFKTREGRQDNYKDLWDLISEWSINKSKFDIARKGQDKRIPCFPVNTIEDLMTDKHLLEREFFIELDHPYVGSLKYPGVAYKLSNAPKYTNKFSAPVLGQDNSMLAELIGDLNE
ncbi:MAG: hypothetical protein CL758_00760 [Chloroflexi bacterium]|nr:hypothetical protein [Chloroflexota bacterium]|tara:strand:+ start:8464 stop:9657 length:1194 start_codon:yes stop_codon:yes gene_type:complete